MTNLVMMTKDECKSTTDIVEYLLQHFPITRDDNYELWFSYLIAFCDLETKLGKEKFNIFKEVVMNDKALKIDMLVKVKSRFQTEGHYHGEKMKAKLRIQEMKNGLKKQETN